MPCFASSLTAEADDEGSSNTVAQSNKKGDLSCRIVSKQFIRARKLFSCSIESRGVLENIEGASETIGNIGRNIGPAKRPPSNFAQFDTF